MDIEPSPGSDALALKRQLDAIDGTIRTRILY